MPVSPIEYLVAMRAKLDGGTFPQLEASPILANLVRVICQQQGEITALHKRLKVLEEGETTISGPAV